MSKTRLYVTCCNILGLRDQKLAPNEYVELTDSEAQPLLASDSIKRVVEPVAGQKKKPAALTYEGELPEGFPHRQKLEEANLRTGGRLSPIRTYEELRATSDEDLLKIHQLGEASVDEIRRAYESEMTREKTYGDEADLDDLPA